VPLDQAEQRIADQEGLTRALFDRGTLVHLYVGRWTGNKKMHERDLLIDTVDPSTMYIGHKKLLPKAAQEKLQWLEGQARSFLSGRSLPFPIGGARFAYFKALPEILVRFKQYKLEWDAAVNELVEGYPRFMEEQLRKLDEQAHALAEAELEKTAVEKRRDRRLALREWEEAQSRQNRELYPVVTELRARFTFEWRMFRVGTVEGDQLRFLDADEIRNERNRLSQDLNRWVTEATSQMHQELGAAAAQAKRLLEENGKLNPKNLKPLFDAFETFQAVNFAGNSQFQAIIEQVRGRYLVRDGGGNNDYRMSAESVNGSTAEMKKLLTTLSTLAVDDVAKEAGLQVVRTGEFQRYIEL
jgi:hypothetical protein